MYLAPAIICLLPFVLAKDGMPKIDGPIPATHDGAIQWCTKPNMQGTCTLPTFWSTNKCCFVTDADTFGVPGSSWKIPAMDAVCNLYTSRTCDGDNTGFAKNIDNVPGKKTFRSFKCQSEVLEELDVMWPSYNHIENGGTS